MHNDKNPIEQMIQEVEEYAIFMLDPYGIIRSWNRGAEKIKEYSAAEAIGNHFRMFYTTEDQQMHLPESLLAEAGRQGKVLNAGWRRARSGRVFWGSDVITALRDTDGTVTSFLKISRDQTDAKKDEERFRLVVESAPNAMVLVNKEGRIALVNGEAEKVFGYSRDELLDRPVEKLIPDRFTHGHPNLRNQYLQAPSNRAMGAGRDLYARRKDGTEFPVEIGLNPIDTREGPMVLAAIIDITERKKAEERFRMVVESAPNAIVLINAGGVITLVNSATEKVFGYDRTELIGNTVEILIPFRYRGMHPRYRTSFFSTPGVRPMGAGRDLFALRKDGTEFPVEIGLSPIESSEGTMVLASIIDITERKLLEANRLKSDFLANMSHELRTPLNAILGFSELLVDQRVGPLGDKQLEYLKDIHASGSHLLQLINNVLDLAKIESGKSELLPESFVLTEVVQGVINTVKPLANKKRIEIRLNIPASFGVVVLDKNKLRQILYNLLSNAIKFNVPEGVVELGAVMNDDKTFTLLVKDTGPGISKEDIKKLFVPFVQLDTGTTRQYEGSGLGLALTKNIVELHRGQIGVDSEPGSGSTFWVTLPTRIQSAK